MTADNALPPPERSRAPPGLAGRHGQARDRACARRGGPGRCARSTGPARSSTRSEGGRFRGSATSAAATLATDRRAGPRAPTAWSPWPKASWPATWAAATAASASRSWFTWTRIRWRPTARWPEPWTTAPAFPRKRFGGWPATAASWPCGHGRLASNLTIGRRSRSIPPAIRRALMLRDRGCAFPGCTHTRFLHGHHIQHWLHGGETSLDNLALLCSHHHHLVHEGGWSVAANGGRGIVLSRARRAANCPRCRRARPAKMRSRSCTNGPRSAAWTSGRTRTCRFGMGHGRTTTGRRRSRAARPAGEHEPRNRRASHDQLGGAARACESVPAEARPKLRRPLPFAASLAARPARPGGVDGRAGGALESRT